MLKLDDCKVAFFSAGLIGILLFASPTLSLVWHWPGGEKFSELWVLGSEHMAEGYPYNVKAGKSYSVYVDVSNHLGSSAYYTVYVKFRNQSEPLPNSASGTPSPLPPLYKYRMLLQDGKSWETALTFSFSKVSFFNNQSQVGSVTVNNATYEVDKSASWDAKNRGYNYQLFIELWIYTKITPLVYAIQYHNRFVSLSLNMTG